MPEPKKNQRNNMEKVTEDRAGDSLCIKKLKISKHLEDMYRFEPSKIEPRRH
jgi:hypothetical protein